MKNIRLIIAALILATALPVLALSLGGSGMGLIGELMNAVGSSLGFNQENANSGNQRG